MGQLLRTWLGLGALGAGIIHLAIAAGASAALLVVFVVIGAAEVAWGVSALARPQLVRPRLAMAGALLPVAVWLAVLLSGSDDMAGMSGMPAAEMRAMTPALPPGGMLGATALDLLVASGLAMALRRSAAAVPVRRGAAVPEVVPEAPAEEHPWRFLLGLLAGAAVVAVVTANSLAATPIGAGGMTGMGH